VKRLLVVLLVIFALVWLPACGSNSPVAIHVDQPRALLDTPLAITISGLRPHERVLVRASTKDARGKYWASKATFLADSAGRVDLRTAAAQGGTYQGVDPMGLFWSMRVTSPTPQNWYCLPGDKSTVTFSVEMGGAVVARQSVVRLTRDPGTPAGRLQSLSEVGFTGEYYPPADTRIRRPAVLVFGGSEGGLSGTLTSSLLAAHGYPALAIAYFDAPGLPAKLANIPLEYFAGALRWLRDQPGVDPGRVLVYGVSRGSEAALLLGVHYPELVNGVIALVPSSVSQGSMTGHPGPVWMLGGDPLPYSNQGSTLHPADNPDAEIQVEKIGGPIFLDCGEGDRAWLSCPYAQAIIDRLEANHHPYPHVLLSYPNAGHGVGFPVPNFPDVWGFGSGLATAPDATAKARQQIWPRLLDFLSEFAKT